MKSITFGQYLKQLRIRREPKITQEQLAVCVQRNKMTISQFENGKNAPPQGLLLDNIINALNLTQEEEDKLRFLSACERAEIPNDVYDYFIKHPILYSLIKTAKHNNVDDEFWERLYDEIGGGSKD